LSDHVCEDCGKTYKSRSGLWKHQKKFLHGKFRSESSGEAAKPSNPSPHPPSTIEATHENAPPLMDESPEDTIPIEEERPSWFDWDFSPDEEASDVLPTPLRSIARSPQMGSSSMSKAQREALEKQNKAILKMGLTAIDVGLTKYGKAVSLDEEFEVKHTEEDKDLVASAQYRYLEEKGLFLTNYLSSGVIAASLTGWYIGTPILRIRKNAKRRLIRGRLLSRLPLIGRFFKPKVEVAPIAQNTEGNFA